MKERVRLSSICTPKTPIARNQPATQLQVRSIQSKGSSEASSKYRLTSVARPKSSSSSTHSKPTMAPIDTLYKRTSCDYYGKPCAPHSTAILAVVSAISILTASILLFYCLRKRTSAHSGPTRLQAGLVHPHKVQRMEARATWRRGGRYEGDVGTELPRYEERSDQPPPYGVAIVRPEGVHYGARRL